MPNCSEDVEGPLLEPPTRFAVANAFEIGPSTSWTRTTRVAVPAATAPCGYDLAVLTLERPLGDIPADVFVGDATRDLSVTGYGATDSNGAGAGVRRTVRPAAFACAGGAAGCGAAPGGVGLALGEVLVDVRACPGDSGGGAFALTDGRVSGILSRSLEGAGACGLAVYTSLDRHLLWLARNIAEVAKADGVAPPDWTARAEARGNGGGVGRSTGLACNDDADCASGLCRTPDGARSFVCARPCTDRCSCAQTSRGPACFGADVASTGCAIGPAGSGASAVWLTGVMASAAVRRRRRKIGPVRPRTLLRTGHETAASDILSRLNRSGEALPPRPE